MDCRPRSLGALALLLMVAVATAPALAQERIEGDRYQNPRYGIQIEKPPRWHFITASTVMDIARKAAGLGAPPADADPVKTAGFAVIVSKSPTLGREVSPQVILAVQDLPRPPGTWWSRGRERLRSGMNDPENVADPTGPPRRPSGGAARLQGLRGRAQCAHALCTFQDRRAFVVVGQALATEFDAETVTFDTILRSFKLR
jgi:hypothetical protein